MERLTEEPRRCCRASNVVTLILVGCIGLFLMFLFFAPFGVRPGGAGRRVSCQNNQKQLALAILMYDSKHGHYPGYSNIDADGGRLGWYALLLPYLRNDIDPKSIHAGSEGLYLPLAVCPSNKPDDATPGFNSYVVNCGQPDAPAGPETPPDWKANGVFFDHGRDQPNIVKMDSEYIQRNDGCGTTMMLTENIDAGSWTSNREPMIGVVYSTKEFGDLTSDQLLMHAINEHRGESDGRYRFARPSSNHPGGVVMSFCDGHQRFFSQDTDRLILALIMTPDGQRSRRAGSNVVVPVLANTPLDEKAY